jgi:hypothetical protein
MRHLHEVINQMLPVVPKELGERLSYVLEKVSYTPPEAMNVRWFEIQDELNRFLPPDPAQLVEWQKSMLKVWTGKEWK